MLTNTRLQLLDDRTFSYMSSSVRGWIVAQLGAREHYAIPRALHRQGALRRLYTDVWCGWGRSILQSAPDPIRSFANRFHSEIPSDQVTSYTGWALTNQIRNWMGGVQSDEERYRKFVRVGESFARRVRDELRQKSTESDLSQSVYFGYDTGSLEVLEFLDGTDAFTILDQVDPGLVEKEIVLKEIERWSGWASVAPVHYEPYHERRKQEWTLASAVVVNSEWSKRALIQQGVSGEKIYVVPLAYQSHALGSEARAPSKESSQTELRVLWLGQVNLRKGIQYLVEAAWELRDAPVRIDVVGPLRITDEAVKKAPSNMSFHGRVPRDETPRFYRNADVFVLPTLSDGFALTQLEAMAQGLPVVTTPNCGRVVTDNKDGLIIPPRDEESLAEAIVHCIENRDHVRQMANQARATSRQYSLHRVAEELLSIPPR